MLWQSVSGLLLSKGLVVEGASPEMSQPKIKNLFQMYWRLGFLGKEVKDGTKNKLLGMEINVNH